MPARRRPSLLSSGFLKKQRQRVRVSMIQLDTIGLFMVAILGPFSAHFQTHFRLIFVYLAEKQTKGNQKWDGK